VRWSTCLNQLRMVGYRAGYCKVLRVSGLCVDGGASVFDDAN